MAIKYSKQTFLIIFLLLSYHTVEKRISWPIFIQGEEKNKKKQKKLFFIKKKHVFYSIKNTI